MLHPVNEFVKLICIFVALVLAVGAQSKVNIGKLANTGLFSTKATGIAVLLIQPF